MSNENMVLRTVYVDPDVDDHLHDEALDKQVSKAELFRKYLVNGIKAAKTHPDLLTPSIKGDQPLVLRTIHMDPKLDDKLRVEAFDSRTSKNDLMRRYVQIGMSMRDPHKKASSRTPLSAAIKQEPIAKSKTRASKRRQTG